MGTQVTNGGLNLGAGLLRMHTELGGTALLLSPLPILLLRTTITRQANAPAAWLWLAGPLIWTVGAVLMLWNDASGWHLQALPNANAATHLSRQLLGLSMVGLGSASVGLAACLEAWTVASVGRWALAWATLVTLAFGVLGMAYFVLHGDSSSSSATADLAFVHHSAFRWIRWPWTLIPVSVLVAGLAGLSRDPGSPRTRPTRVLAAFALVSILAGVVLREILSLVPLDAHLHDSYFAVAAEHALIGWPVLLGVLAALTRWRPYGGALPWVGAGLVALGVIIAIWAELAVGVQGMPRRYVSYIQEFQASQGWARAGALTALSGAALIVAMSWRSRTE